MGAVAGVNEAAVKFFFIRKKCWDGIEPAAVYGRLGSSS